MGSGQGVLVWKTPTSEGVKVTRRIARVHKLKDKTSGGFLMGPCLVFLLLVSDRITVPVRVAFYEPEPTRHRAYPTKPELWSELAAMCAWGHVLDRSFANGNLSEHSVRREKSRRVSAAPRGATAAPGGVLK